MRNFVKVLEVKSPFGVEIAVRKKRLTFMNLIFIPLLLKHLEVT